MKDASPRKTISPSVRYVVSILKERIHSGQYAHGHRLPAERSLAEEFSVCRPIVRQAIVELEEHDLIQRTAGHRPVVWHGRTEPTPLRNDALLPSTAGTNVGTMLGIPTLPPMPHQTAQSIGLWISGTPRDTGPVALTSGIHQELAAQESTLRLVMTCPKGASLRDVIDSEATALERMAADPDIGGVILWYLGGEDNRSVLETMRKAKKALVFVDREPPAGFEADFVGVHNRYAAAEAVRYLISQGHRHIAHVTNTDRASTVQERRQGYQQALQDAGVPFRSEYVVHGPFKTTQEEQEQWHELVARLLALPEPPTAAFALNDYTAYQLIRTLRAVGLRVPEDMAVVGFDNSERWSALDPFMTSVSQPFDQIGREAVRLLLQRYRTEQQQTYRHLLLPASLVLRRSSEHLSNTK